jgi:hypothetical protein
MLALTDAALARVIIAATAVPPGRRRQWLRELSAKLDPPRTPAVRRQARWRARQRDGSAVYRLTGRVIEVEALDHARVERALAAGSESESGARPDQCPLRPTLQTQVGHLVRAEKCQEHITCLKRNSFSAPNRSARE